MKRRLFLLLACVYLLFASREQPWGDAHVVYDTTAALIERHALDVTLPGPPQFFVARHGKRYGVFPLGNVVAMAPGYFAYLGLRLLPKAPEELIYRYTSHLPTSLLIAGACVLFFALARREGAGPRAAMWLALVLGLGTLCTVYARAPYSEALQTLAMTWVVERTLAVGDRPSKIGAFWLGVACGLLFNTKLVYALALLVVPVYLALLLRRDLRRLLAVAAAAAPPALILCAGAIAHNWWKTGTFFDTGYQIPNGVFSGDAYAGLWGYFFSTGKSVFLYSPPLLITLCALPAYVRSHRRHALFLGALSAVVVLSDAKFRYWHADYCWGPRLLVPLVPAWLLPIAPWIEGALARGRRWLRALAVGALCGAGLYVQILGSAFYWDHYIRIAIAVKDQTGAAGWYGEDLHQCHFIPQFSPLVGHAWLLGHLLRGDPDPTVDAPWRRVVPQRVDLSREWSAVRADWWAIDWFDKKTGSRRAGAAIAGLTLAFALSAALGLRRRLRDLDRARASDGAAASPPPSAP